MHITDGLADLKELFVLINGVFEFAEVVVEHSSGIVRAPFVTRLACSLTGKGKHVVIF